MAEFLQSLIATIEADLDSKPRAAANWEQIAAAEAQAGFPFPPSYKQFLLHCNGGELGNYLIFGVDCCWDSEKSAFDIVDRAQSLIGMMDGIQEGDVYPFGETWGGDYVCFNLREKSDDGEYPILYWNHEESEGGDAERLWSRIADNFTDFMQEHYDDLMQLYYENLDD